MVLTQVTQEVCTKNATSVGYLDSIMNSNALLNEGRKRCFISKQNKSNSKLRRGLVVFGQKTLTQQQVLWIEST